MELLAGILPLAPLPADISIQPRYFKRFVFCFMLFAAGWRKHLETMLQLLKEHWCLGRSTSWQSQQSPYTNSDSQNSRQLQLGSPREAFALPPAKGQSECGVSDVWNREFHVRPPGVSPPNSGRRRCLKTKPSQVAIRVNQVLRSHQVHLPSSKAFITEEHFETCFLCTFNIFKYHILFCLASKLPTNRKLKLLQLFFRFFWCFSLFTSWHGHCLVATSQSIVLLSALHIDRDPRDPWRSPHGVAAVCKHRKPQQCRVATLVFCCDLYICFLIIP